MLEFLFTDKKTEAEKLLTNWEDLIKTCPNPTTIPILINRPYK